MSDRLRVDLETYSPVDLGKDGVYRYASHPDFLILMASYSLNGADVVTGLEWGDIAAIPGLRDPDVTKVAHNAQFERVCFSSHLQLGTGVYLPPEEWHDTQAVAAEYGWPQGLDNLARALGATRKDEAGTRLINLFCKPNRKGQRNRPEDYPEEWLDFIAYCEQDVETLAEVDELVGDFPTETERRVFWVDQHINDRGIAIDGPMARAAVAAAGANQVEQVYEMIEATNWTVLNPNSQPQMMKWVEANGLNAKNLRKETVAELLEGDLTTDQRRVLELRQELALVASKKYASALRNVLPDDRLRGTLKFFGAHTARWTGRGTQVQNLPREQLTISAEEAAWLEASGWPKPEREAWKFAREEDIVDEAIRTLLTTRTASSHELKALVRALFVGPFTVVDYAAIEARVIAWLAGELWALQAFRDGRDIYTETAERIGGLNRSEGKILVLAMGFAGGVNSFRAMGGSTADSMTDDQIWKMVKQWRRANGRIVQLWSDLADAFADTGKVGDHLSVTQSYDNMGRAVHIELPSGRAISYHNVKWEKYAVPDPLRPGKYIRKEGWRYADPRNPFNPNMRIGTYGGRLAENVTQAVARDVMAGALVRLHDAGIPTVGHVHDEIINDGTHDIDLVSSIMCQVPSWATGLPIDGEGFTCRRYRKG